MELDVQPLGSHRSYTSTNTFLTLYSRLISFWSFGIIFWRNCLAFSASRSLFWCCFSACSASTPPDVSPAQHASLFVTEACRSGIACSSQLARLFEAVVVLLVVVIVVIPEHPELVAPSWVTRKQTPRDTPDLRQAVGCRTSCSIAL